MNLSRCVPWNRDPAMRTKKKSRTRGSLHRMAKLEKAAGSVGQRPKGAAKNSRKMATGKRNAVMKPPREKSPQSSGSRRTSGGPSTSAWTVSRPGLQARDSRAGRISSAISDPPEDQVHDGARDDDPQEQVDREHDLPRQWLPRELDRLRLADEHEP